MKNFGTVEENLQSTPQIPFRIKHFTAAVRPALDLLHKEDPEAMLSPSLRYSLHNRSNVWPTTVLLIFYEIVHFMNPRGVKVFHIWSAVNTIKITC